jgi:hypothetical protein
MRSDIGFGSVDFNEYKLRGIVPLLDKIEPHYTRLLNAMPGIFDGRFTKSRQVVRFHLGKNMDDEHG